MATTLGSAAQVVPGKSLGFIALGSSLQYILTRLRSHEKVFTSISTIYDPSSPLASPVIILLDNNGIRLRFDGPDQRLRLIEILDFSKCRLTYNGGELVRPGSGPGGPTCKSVYNKLFGPTYPGEYLEDQCLYVLSYPGVAFSFSADKKTWKSDVDFVSLLSGVQASSMAIFAGPSWVEVRDDLFTKQLQSHRIPAINSQTARLSPASDEVESLHIRDAGEVEIVRRHNPPFVITLHSTNPQDLVAELGPPSAIYRKSDHRLNIHRASRSAAAAQEVVAQDDTSASDDDEDLSDLSATSNSDCFYNYFHHGIDIFLSAARSSSHPVVTKVIVHGNVPGSYEFNRYRRCRWTIDHKSPKSLLVHSEQTFEEMRPALKARFHEIGKPMPYSRGSDSPSSSCELLGGWEDKSELKGTEREETTFGDTELYGLPGFIFEILKNGAVTCLTVF